MTNTAPIKLFQFPRMFATPNISPFCCKLETWLRIAGIPYEVVDTPDPRKGPKGKVPFIEEGGRRIGDSALIIDHLKRTRGIDPDARLDDRQRATTLVVQRTIEEHYAFIVLYTHFIRDAGWQHMQSTLQGVPTFIRPFVLPMVRGHMRKALNMQGTLRHSDEEIMDAARRDWQAILSLASDEPFFFGAEPSTVDATLFGALATTLFTPVPSPIRDFLESQPKIVAYAERMRAKYFPELAAKG
jgi:glutathione S-transferase